MRMSEKRILKGKIVEISGPVVKADNMSEAKIYEVARVGNSQLIGEIIQLKEDIATIQVYEDTSGLEPGEPVTVSGEQFR